MIPSYKEFVPFYNVVKGWKVVGCWFIYDIITLIQIPSVLSDSVTLQTGSH